MGVAPQARCGGIGERQPAGCPRLPGRVARQLVDRQAAARQRAVPGCTEVLEASEVVLIANSSAVHGRHHPVRDIGRNLARCRDVRWQHPRRWTGSGPGSTQRRSPSPAKVCSPKSLATGLSVVSSPAARLGVEAHALYEDDLGSVVVQRHDIPDRHAVCG
jgi:hypothetical protein